MSMRQYETEQAFLADYNIHDFDVPLCTVDMTIFTVRQQQLSVLLVKRGEYPQKDLWALPGGFIDLKQDDSLEQTAFRKLYEKTGVRSPYLEQVATMGNAQRDPRGWSLTVLYFALMSSEGVSLQNRDASGIDVQWVPFQQALQQPLAFDHVQLLQNSYQRLRSKVLYTSLPIHLMPASFTLPQLQKTYEIILDAPLQKKSFRKRMLDAGIIEETGEKESGPTRPAALYRATASHALHVFPRTLEGVHDVVDVLE